MTCSLSRLSCALACQVVVTSAFAQNADVLVLPRLDGEIIVDGLIDEPAWDKVTAWLPVQYEPDNGAPPTEATEFLVAYDADYIYFALRASDSDPSGIRANTLYRDRLSGDDHFEVMLDTFNDNETAVLFTTTPNGIRKDAAISNDASGGGIASGGWINGDFNTFWDVETVVDDRGWFAEIRVPFSSLRFPAGQFEVTMGITLQRKVARKTERVTFPHVESVANWAFLKPSLGQKVLLKGITPKNPLYVSPYAVLGAGQSNTLGAERGAYVQSVSAEREAGLDLKNRLTDNLTMDLTLNTDFAQVEADDEQVNLTRFSLFIPEKRQFFQERAGIFNFRTGGLSRLFHSRRIGLTGDGLPVRLLGGMRVVGRAGLWDLGFLDLQTAESDMLPSENFGVLRVRRQVFNPYSYAGGMATSRIGSDGKSNVAYGLDGVIRLRGQDYLTVQWAQSFDSDTPTEGLGSGRFTFEVERRSRREWGYSAAVAWAGPDYDPGIGFTQRNDFTLSDNTLSYTWLPPEASPLIWHTLGIRGFAFFRNGDGSVESAEFGPEWEVSAKSGEGGSVELKTSYEDLASPFALSDDVTVPSGSYTFHRVGASYHRSHTALVQVRPRFEVGSFYDGWNVGLGVQPIWYVSPHLELAGSYLYNQIRFPDRDQVLHAHLARLRIGTALDTKLSVNAFVQYNSTVDLVSANVRFRYNFREGNDFWIVYSETINGNRDRLRPRLPLLDTRTILLKYTRTLQF